MREPVDRPRLEAFMRALAAATRRPLQVYLVGGATAVFEGWRDSTVDVEPELYRFPAVDPPSFRRAVETVTSFRQ